MLDWVLDEAQLFRVNADDWIYYGIYDFEAGMAQLFDNPIRVPRRLEEGGGYALNAAVGPIAVQQTITLLRRGVTVPALAVPGASDLTDCALIQINSTIDDVVQDGLEAWAPTRGEVWLFWYENEGGAEVESYASDKVNAWGTAANYPAFMSEDLPGALATLNGLTLSDDDLMDAERIGGNRVVVVPLGD